MGTIPRVVCKLIGEDGNIFNLLGVAMRELRKHKMDKQAQEMKERVTMSHSYSEALNIISKYVKIV